MSMRYITYINTKSNEISCDQNEISRKNRKNQLLIEKSITIFMVCNVPCVCISHSNFLEIMNSCLAFLHYSDVVRRTL